MLKAIAVLMFAPLAFLIAVLALMGALDWVHDRLIALGILRD